MPRRRVATAEAPRDAYLDGILGKLGSVQTTDPRQLTIPAVLEDLDAALDRVRASLGVGMHLTLSSPDYRPPFCLLTWQKLERIREEPGSSRVVQARTLRECLAHVEEYERLAASPGGLRAANLFHNAERKRAEG